MRKLKVVIVALLLGIVAMFGIAGCSGTQSELRGKYYSLQTTYDNGWLNEDDLKSIACAYYNNSHYEDNPYSGLFDPNKELSVEMEKELKQAYLNQYAEYPDGSLEYVNIIYYYGTYGGNVAVRISGYICIEPPDNIPEQTYIGGVIFKNFWGMDILVYHID